jgi:hypothetical protein
MSVQLTGFTIASSSVVPQFQPIGAEVRVPPVELCLFFSGDDTGPFLNTMQGDLSGPLITPPSQVSYPYPFHPQQCLTRLLTDHPPRSDML